MDWLLGESRGFAGSIGIPTLISAISVVAGYLLARTQLSFAQHQATTQTE